jgi:uncharacterized protein (TIGR02246 family)
MDDAQAIARVVVLYSQLLDDRRMDEWGELFTEDAVWSTPQLTLRGRQGIAQGVGEMQRSLAGNVKHMSFTPSIEIDTSESARAWTDLTVLVRRDGVWGFSAAGRYYDHFVKGSDGRWRIASRAADINADEKPELPLTPPPAR